MFPWRRGRCLPALAGTSLSTNPKPRQNWRLCESPLRTGFPLGTLNGQSELEKPWESKREFGPPAARELAGRGREGFRVADFYSCEDAAAKLLLTPSGWHRGYARQSEETLPEIGAESAPAPTGSGKVSRLVLCPLSCLVHAKPFPTPTQGLKKFRKFFSDHSVLNTGHEYNEGKPGRSPARRPARRR